MDIKTAFRMAINPALALLPAKMDTLAARVILVAIALQESRFEHRFQVVQGKPGVKGPARGFWQFERGGGIKGVLTHAASRDHADRVCKLRGVQPIAADVHEAVETDDVLAAVFARLLLWTDTWRLPGVGDVGAAWDLYIRTWRPGKPHPETWPQLYARAVAECGGINADAL